MRVERVRRVMKPQDFDVLKPCAGCRKKRYGFTGSFLCFEEIDGDLFAVGSGLLRARCRRGICLIESDAQ